MPRTICAARSARARRCSWRSRRPAATWSSCATQASGTGGSTFPMDTRSTGTTCSSGRWAGFAAILASLSQVRRRKLWASRINVVEDSSIGTRCDSFSALRSLVMELDASNLPHLARGCAVLGAGGGGDVSTGLLAALQAVESHGPVTLLDLDDLPVDGLIMPCGYIGAPTVSIEKLGNGGEGLRLRDGIEEALGRPVTALMAAEIGGSNGLHPIGW